MANVLPTQMSGIPPTVLDTLPALQPPAGVRSDFVSPDDRGYVLNATATVLFGFMLCLFANRVYTKVSIVREASWDDCMCASLVFYSWAKGEEMLMCVCWAEVTCSVAFVGHLYLGLFLRVGMLTAG